MKRGLALLLLIVLGVLAAAFWFTRSSRRPTSVDIDSAPIEHTATSGAQIDDAAPASASVRQESPVVEVRPVPAIEVPTARIADASIRGRFVLASGSPAADVELSITSAITRKMRARAVDLSPDSQVVLGESDVNGAFAVRFAPVLDAAVELEAKLAGHGVEIWNWTSIQPGVEIDVGEVRLRLEGIVRGRVLDKNGAGLAGWTVTATDLFLGENFRQVSTSQSDPDGSYRLENLPAGSFTVSATAQNSAPTKQAKVRIAPGHVIDLDLRYDGVDLARRVVANPRYARTAVFLHGDWIEMALIAPGVADRRPVVIKANPMRFSFDDIEPGEYSIQLRDPRLKSVTVEHVRPGAMVDIEINGGAALALTVVDDANGERIERYSVESRNESLFGRGTLCTLLDDSSAHSGETVVEGVLVIDQTLIVRADGRAPLEIPIRGLQSGERRAIEVRLTPGAVLEGVVIGSVSRRPIPSARVRLLRKPPPPLIGQQRLGESMAGPSSAATTDAEGRFKISGVGLGEIEAAVTIDSMSESGVRLAGLDSVREQRTPLSITEPGVTRVELEGPSAGRLVGRLITPPGASLADLGLFIARLEKSTGQKEPRTSGGSGARIEANGEFITPWIEAGDAVVRLMQRRERAPVGDPNWSMNSNSWIELGVVTLAHDEDTRRDFDLRATFPCVVDLFVTMGGGPAPALDVELRDKTLEHRSWIAPTDEKGRARVPVVPPSTYTVFVRDPDSKWVWTDPRELRVDPGVTTRHDVVVELVNAELTIRTGSPPAPLASARIKLDPVGAGKSSGAVVTTDASGRALVKLQLGKWTVRKQYSGGPKQPTEVAEFELSAAGPRAFTVDLVESPR